MNRRIAFTTLFLLAGATVACAQSTANVTFPTYETRYYSIHTDLTGDALKEAELRMTKMAEEYRVRTRGFIGSADRKLPFYLFKNRADYLATGVPKESAGVFTGQALLAVAGEETNLLTWNTIQHEGFHQYVHAVIGQNIPTWVNEGLAEYFGEGLFTGDDFQTGLIPQWRLKRVREAIKDDKFIPLADMMALPSERWNAKLSVYNYDQAWSMVQFLAHGDDGRYQKPFGAFIAGVGRGVAWQTAWRDNFGDIPAFERRWKAYWSGLPDNPTAPTYGKVGAQILTSFFARAYAARQRFETVEEFLKALKAGEIKTMPADWLPPSLGSDGADFAKLLGTWSIDPGLRGQTPRLVLKMRDGTRVTGSFTLDRTTGRVSDVSTVTRR